MTSCPSSTRNVEIAIRGLRWPVAGVEAIRIFMMRSIHRVLECAAHSACGSLHSTAEMDRGYGFQTTKRLRIWRLKVTTVTKRVQPTLGVVEIAAEFLMSAPEIPTSAKITMVR